MSTELTTLSVLDFDYSHKAPAAGIEMSAAVPHSFKLTALVNGKPESVIATAPTSVGAVHNAFFALVQERLAAEFHEPYPYPARFMPCEKFTANEPAPDEAKAAIRPELDGVYHRFFMALFSSQDAVNFQDYRVLTEQRHRDHLLLTEKKAAHATTHAASVSHHSVGRAPTRRKHRDDGPRNDEHRLDGVTPR